MSTIKSSEKLAGILPEKELSVLENGARRFRKFSNIEFEIEEVGENEITVIAEQGPNASGNYANQRRLVKRAHELFDKSLPPGFKLKVKPLEFFESPAAKVTPAWIEAQMEEKGVRIKQIAFDTGINKSDISAWINNIKPMSQIVKALFYYYFSSK